MEGCNIPPGNGPVIYQLYASNAQHELLFPVTLSQFSTVFLFFGLPLIDSQANIYAVKLCDTFNYCQVIFSNSVQVRQSWEKKVDLQKLLSLAKRHFMASDYLYGLSLINLIIRDTQLSHKLFTQAINSVLEFSFGLLTHYKPSYLTSKGHLSLIYSLYTKLISHGFGQSSLDIIFKITQKCFAFDTLPDLDTLKVTLSHIIGEFIMKPKIGFQSINILKTVHKACQILLQAMAAQIPLGKKVEFGDTDLSPNKTKFGFKTIVFHEKAIHGIQLNLGMINVSVKIGPVFYRQFYKSWNCSSQYTQKCHSVVFAYTIYLSPGLYRTIDANAHLSPIVELNVFAPYSGAPQTVKSGINLIEIILNNLTKEAFSTSYTSHCYSWNKESQSWETIKTTLLQSSSNQAACWSQLLRPVSIIRVERNTKFALILLPALLLVTTVLLIFAYLSILYFL